jgi:hypothetical protein
MARLSPIACAPNDDGDPRHGQERALSVLLTTARDREMKEGPSSPTIDVALEAQQAAVVKSHRGERRGEGRVDATAGPAGSSGSPEEGPLRWSRT